MLNTVLENNHEEMYELHFKHEIMEHQLVRGKHAISSAQSLMAKIKLIMACEDPNYRMTLADLDDHSRGGFSFDRQATTYNPNERMKPKTNFFGETYEVPAGHSYPTNEDLAEARA